MTTFLVGGVAYVMPRLLWKWHRPVKDDVLALMKTAEHMARLYGGGVADDQAFAVLGEVTEVLDPALKVLAAGLRQNYDQECGEVKAAGRAIEAVMIPPDYDTLASVLTTNEWGGVCQSITTWLQEFSGTGEAAPAGVDAPSLGTEIQTP